jgi:SecD/SecF fusion protein
LALLRQADVYPVNPRNDGVTADTFTIKTLATDKPAIVEALVGKFKQRGLVDLLPPLGFDGLASDAVDSRGIPAYKVITGNLGDDLLRPGTTGDARDYVGGVAILLENLSPAEPLSILTQRLDSMRAQPDFADTQSRSHEVRVLRGTSDAVESAVVLVNDPAASFFDNEQAWEQGVKLREWSLVREALTKTSTPASVDTFSPTIAATFKAQAVVTTVLSFLLLGIYIWIRFGAVSYAVAAIVPLIHDVFILIGLVALAGMLYESPTTLPIAHALGILPFKIDLNMVAALLTVVGYSLNDTIIIMDRIRELRGKMPHATKRIINDAVNQTFSRTIITSGTTFFSTIMLYMFGGEGMRGFAYVLTLGVFVGTYSSIAVTAPIVWSRRHDPVEPGDGIGSPSASPLA